jgi:sugar lactone lactonase YvrE
VPGELLLLLRDGFYVRGSDGDVVPLARPLAETPEIRFNDGKVDPRGRAFGGSMPYAVGPPDAVLYRLDSPGLSPGDESSELDSPAVATPCVSGLSLSNGLGWSPDGRQMYLIDSQPGTVWRYDYDLDTGAMSDPEVLLQVSRQGGVMPDGLTVDDDGCLWVALWGAGECHRYSPDGRLDRVIALPVTQPTSMCFAGADLSTLIITTATYGLDEAALAAQPLAGGVFALDANCTGPAATPWRPTH